MNYATPADLLERYEADLLAQRAAPEGLRVSGPLLQLTVAGADRSAYTVEEIAAADAGLARIQQALADAAAFIDSHLSDLYALPLSPVPRMVQRIACEIARYYLWGDAASRDGVEERDFKAAQKVLESIRRGEQKLGVQPDLASTSQRISGEVFGGGERLFTRSALRGL